MGANPSKVSVFQRRLSLSAYVKESEAHTKLGYYKNGLELIQEHRFLSRVIKTKLFLLRDLPSAGSETKSLT
jgi:hypothetical protein